MKVFDKITKKVKLSDDDDIVSEKNSSEDKSYDEINYWNIINFNFLRNNNNFILIFFNVLWTKFC